MTEKDELLQAKERELAEAQQQVSTYIMCVMLHVLMYSVMEHFLTAGD